MTEHTIYIKRDINDKDVTYTGEPLVSAAIVQSLSSNVLVGVLSVNSVPVKVKHSIQYTSVLTRTFIHQTGEI